MIYSGVSCFFWECSYNLNIMWPTGHSGNKNLPLDPFKICALLGPLKGGVSVECWGQIFYSFGCRLENHNVECRLGIVTIFHSTLHQNKSVNFILVTSGLWQFQKHSKWTCLFMTFGLSGHIIYLWAIFPCSKFSAFIGHIGLRSIIYRINPLAHDNS